MSKIIVNAHAPKNIINKNIYGHFSEHLGRCIYEGLYVGENSDIPNVNGMRTDVVEALKQIKVPVLRWPGGCFADEYHWKDGIGPKESRKKMINTHWGGVVEDNSFGTHEFLELCRQIGCEPYINGNVGSGTVQEMSEWMEYMTFDGVSPMAELRKKNGQEKPWKVKYFGIGNENWGCGGNMRPEYYGDLFRRYGTYVRNYGDNHVFRIACGANVDDYDWTDGVMKVAGRYMDAITLHYYTHPLGWQIKGSALEFGEDVYYITLEKAQHMEDLLKGHLAVMDKYDPEHRVGLIVDEWGTWYTVEPGTNPGFLYQQNTIRDAMVAALHLDIFNRHSDRVIMTNIAQMVNVLQSVILTDGAQMLKTPTYHVYDLYKYHQDATLLESRIQDPRAIRRGPISAPSLSQSASVDENGVIHITVSNLNMNESDSLRLQVLGGDTSKVKARILTGEVHAHNTFENPDAVHIVDFTDFTTEGDTLCATLPPCSVALFTVGE